MKKWIFIAVGTALIVTTQCAARKSYNEREAQNLKRRIEQHIDQRKRDERRYADRIVNNAKLQTARKRLKDVQHEQAVIDRKMEQQTQREYRDEVRHFAQLTQELALPLYTDRPILDIIHETEFTLQKIATYNPKELHRYQAQFERALRQGKHPITQNGIELYPNAELLARQSIQSLVDYTHNAQQLVEQAATYAQGVADTMNHAMNEHRTALATLNQEMGAQLNNSQQRISTFDAQLTKLNKTLQKAEFEAAQKEAEAVNLAQCIDTFNTMSSKFNQDRITETEKIIEDLQEKAHRAEQHTTILMLRLHAAEKALRAFEKNLKLVEQSAK